MADKKKNDETTAETPETVDETPVAEENPVAEETPAAEEAPWPSERHRRPTRPPPRAGRRGGRRRGRARAAAEEPLPRPVAEDAAQPRLPRSSASQQARPALARRTRTKPRARDARDPQADHRPPKPETELGRRQERRGVVVSDKGDKTIVVKVDVIKSHPKYKKVIRRTVKFHAHDEQNKAGIGDTVRIVETRPLSKTKRWRLAEIVEKAR